MKIRFPGSRRSSPHTPPLGSTIPDSRSGFWSAHQDGKVLCAELELYQLLDRLEWLLEQR